MSSYIAVAHNTTPFVSAYPWSGSGFGTKYSDPGTLPPAAGLGVAFTSAGDALAVVNTGFGTPGDSPPYITVYHWSAGGFGTKFSDPGTLPPDKSLGVAFTRAGDAVAVAHATTPFVTAYPWSGSGFGTKFTNPGTLPAGNGNSVALTAAGDAIAVAHGTTPFISVYPWSVSGFGTKFTNPGTLPAGSGLGVAFTNAGDAIAVAHDASPFITAYPWSGAGFGTKYTDPGTLPGGFLATGVAFTSAGNAIGVSNDLSSGAHFAAYPWNSGTGFGTKFADPATAPGSTQTNSVDFSSADSEIGIAHYDSPFVSAYPWSISGFGTKFTNPGTLPAGTGNSVAFDHPLAGGATLMGQAML